MPQSNRNLLDVLKIRRAGYSLPSGKERGVVDCSFPFTMYDIIALLGLPQPPANRASYNIPCPECDRNGKRHLNIHLQKGVFRCARCGFSGGMLSLYEYYAGCARNSSYREIIAKLALGECVLPKPREPIVEQADNVLADINLRDKAYSLLLRASPLRAEHAENLHGRGLTDSDIKRLGYASTPQNGEATRSLLREYRIQPKGVPGFYSHGDSYKMVDTKSGIMIPLRDIQGRVQGVQIRRDDAVNNKYRFLSSVHECGGCAAKAWVHVAGEPKQGDEVILTEGALKADVVNSITDKPVIAVAGVNSLNLLPPVLTHLESVGISRLMTAYDVDFYTNEHVAKGYDSLLHMLGSYSFDYGTYLWDYRYKGIDDFLNACRNKGRTYERDNSY